MIILVFSLWYIIDDDSYIFFSLKYRSEHPLVSDVLFESSKYNITFICMFIFNVYHYNDGFLVVGISLI
jgi:hypothetical protein